MIIIMLPGKWNILGLDNALAPSTQDPTPSKDWEIYLYVTKFLVEWRLESFG